MQNDDGQRYSVVLVPLFSIVCTVVTLVMGILSEHQLDKGCYSDMSLYQFTIIGFGITAIVLGVVELILAFIYRSIVSGRVAFVAGPVCLLIAIPIVLYSWFVGSFCLTI